MRLLTGEIRFGKKFVGIYIDRSHVYDVVHMSIKKLCILQAFLIVMYISDYYLYYVNVFTVLLLSVNRYTALVYPLQFMKVCSFKYAFFLLWDSLVTKIVFL